MSKVDSAETAILQLILGAKTWTNVASASTASTVIWVSLHTADPGDTGTQATSEISYGGYARIATDRTTAAWHAASGSVSPTATITFPTATSTTTHSVLFFSVGLSSSGAGTALYNGSVSPEISIAQNVTPALTTATAITEA